MARLNTTHFREVLDYVLYNTAAEREYKDVKNFFCTNNSIFPDGDEYYLKMALNKLQQDRYIDFILYTEDVGHFITNSQAGEGLSIRRNFNGHIFLSGGGYQWAERRLIEKEANDAASDNRAETFASDLTIWTKKLAIRTRWLMLATWAVAIGAIGLVIWEIYHSYHS